MLETCQGRNKIFESECVKTHIQWLAKKLVVSISVIRKLAVVFIPVEIQKFV